MGKQFKKTNNRKRALQILLILGTGLVLIITAVWFALLKNGGKVDQNGAPAIAVNQDKIDFGDVKLNTPVSFEFEVTNTGDGALRFSTAPYIEVVEGC